MVKSLGKAIEDFFFSLLSILRYLVFFFLITISTLVTSFLFSSLGADSFHKILFVLIAGSFEIMKAFSLVMGNSNYEFFKDTIKGLEKNSSGYKEHIYIKKTAIKWWSGYTIVAIMSILSSYSFALSSVQHLKDTTSDATSHMRLIAIGGNDTSTGELGTLQNQIDSLKVRSSDLIVTQKRGDKEYGNQITYFQSLPNGKGIWSAQEVIRQKLAYDNSIMSQYNSIEDSITTITNKQNALLLEKGNLQEKINANSSTAKQAFQLLGEFFWNVGDKNMMFFFLILISILIEFFTVVSSPHPNYIQVLEEKHLSHISNVPLDVPVANKDDNKELLDMIRGLKETIVEELSKKTDVLPIAEVNPVVESLHIVEASPPIVEAPLDDPKVVEAPHIVEALPIVEEPIVVSTEGKVDKLYPQEKGKYRIGIATKEDKEKFVLFLNGLFNKVKEGESLNDPHLVGNKLGFSENRTTHFINRLLQVKAPTNNKTMIFEKDGKFYPNYLKDYIVAFMLEEI